MWFWLHGIIPVFGLKNRGRGLPLANIGQEDMIISIGVQNINYKTIDMSPMFCH